MYKLASVLIDLEYLIRQHSWANVTLTAAERGGSALTFVFPPFWPYGACLTLHSTAELLPSWKRSSHFFWFDGMKQVWGTVRFPSGDWVSAQGLQV